MAAAYLLDTNIFSAILRGEPRALLNRMSSLAPERLFVSSVVLGELLVGAEKSDRRVDTLGAVLGLTADMTHIYFTDDDAAIYARIRAALERKGISIGPIDLLIAAQAIAHDLVLITDNLREFRRVPGLACENWMR
jgi:tRNA(fMet)-specific endonuclease VapC